MSVLDLARPEIRAIKPYSSARMEASGGSVLINANELPWSPCADAPGGLNRYPDPQPALLLERLAALYGVGKDQILVGRGSDEAIDLLVRAFCRAGTDEILLSPPTFGMYAVAANIQGAGIGSVPLRADFSLDADALLARVTPQTKLVFVCTPNNPTGNLVPLETIERLAAALSGRAVLVVDEAYVEFAAAPSAATLLARYDNVAVLRTLSKAYGLAGARIGSLLAPAEVIGLLRRIMAPYPLPTTCIDAALAVLRVPALAETRRRIALVVTEREKLRQALPNLPGVQAVLPSAGNFLAVRWTDSALVYANLLSAGIVVRDVGRYPGLANCLRLSIGTPEENERVLDALARDCARPAA
ncbi:histidinol-phosphate transaminase [Tahibacter amnicola]|uniref:Histidinol-phosphate aminotransferase n=1 Tax=Tahibacter amnicola TaxID=2976241 RepID=A0ABY6BB71_9GAMM|nr:histidinol-phosphate transaminase [Tahibacter amnicola]UXI67109.1 histidinol-phosphate transaminase [Tahibacter amnicola]